MPFQGSINQKEPCEKKYFFPIRYRLRQHDAIEGGYKIFHGHGLRQSRNILNHTKDVDRSGGLGNHFFHVGLQELQ